MNYKPEQLEKNKPVKEHKIGQVLFRIYLAKNLYNSKWNSALLKKITLEARHSYLRYGQVPLIDNYDKNAEVYLCRVTYAPMEEWLCVRFVPGSAASIFLEDLSGYFYKGKSISRLIKQKLFFGKNNWQRKLVSMSRLCGISPYFFGVGKKTKPSNSLKYSGQALALVNNHFFSKHNFSYLSAVLRPELLKKILHPNPKASLFLPEAHKTLGCRPEEIYLNRNLFAYHFPGYFLNLFQMIRLLEKLIQEKKLTVNAVKKYVKMYAPDFNKKLKNKKYAEILKSTAGLDKLLLARGRIAGAKINGNELRDLVEKNVDDGPELKIIAVDKWKKQLLKI